MVGGVVGLVLCGMVAHVWWGVVGIGSGMGRVVVTGVGAIVVG